MSVTREQPRANDVHFVISPNRSLSWRGNQLFFAGMVVISFGIAGFFAAQGLWMMLPFAGLEMLLLGIALYRCCLRSGWREVVSIDEREVRIAVGRSTPERACTFQRCWARVILDKAAIKGYPSRLFIRSHGLQVEIGACLVDEERHSLAAALRDTL